LDPIDIITIAVVQQHLHTVNNNHHCAQLLVSVRHRHLKISENMQAVQMAVIVALVVAK
jgi:hypothetical protein